MPHIDERRKDVPEPLPLLQTERHNQGKKLLLWTTRTIKIDYSYFLGVSNF